MATGAVAAASLLGAVFAVAGMGKLRDLDGTQRTMREFGLSEPLASIAGLLVPVGELCVAAGLLVPRAAGAAAVAATSLLVAFSVAILINLARGRRPQCHCFGGLHPAAVGWESVARDVGLIGVAVAAYAGRAGNPIVFYAAASLALVVACVLGVGWLRRYVAGAAGHLALGTVAPTFTLPAVDGSSVTLRSLLGGRPLLLVFADANCAPCIELAPEIVRWQTELAKTLAIAVIERRPSGPDRGPDEHGRLNVLVDEAGEIADAYGAPGTPSAVLVDPAGRIASGAAAGAEQIARLVLYRATGSAGGLDRRELLRRAAAAWAATTAALSWPASAFARVAASGADPLSYCSRGREGNRFATNHLCGGRGHKCAYPPGSDFGDIGTCKCTSETDPHPCEVLRESCPYPKCSPPVEEHTGNYLCTNLKNDPNNCGKCGARCGEGGRCIAGKCVGGGDGTTCQGSAFFKRGCCKGKWTDLSSSSNCGKCGNSCGTGFACCNGVCIDTRINPQNCGSCGNRCPHNCECLQGACTNCV